MKRGTAILMGAVINSVIIKKVISYDRTDNESSSISADERTDR